jgi:hypothetical protein
VGFNSKKNAACVGERRVVLGVRPWSTIVSGPSWCGDPFVGEIDESTRTACPACNSPTPHNLGKCQLPPSAKANSVRAVTGPPCQKYPWRRKFRGAVPPRKSQLNWPSSLWRVHLRIQAERWGRCVRRSYQRESYPESGRGYVQACGWVLVACIGK